MSQRNWLNASSTSGRILRVVAVLLIIFIFVMSSFATFTTTTTGATATINVGVERGFPTVPPEGTYVMATQTYFHHTGLISIPKFDGWELPADNGGEETVLPQGETFGRVGLMFINSGAQSVIHAFAEKDPSRQTSTVNDLDKLYDTTNLNAAWKDYTGGWRELSRRADGDQFVIDFEVKVNTDSGGQTLTDTYLARQISKLDQDWLLTARLVVPSNNPGLLDALQSAAWDHFRFWRAALNSPLEWSVIPDYVLGYVIKYPTGWVIQEGAVGRPFTVIDSAQSPQVTLLTRAVPATVIDSEDAAKTWISTNIPKATIQTVKAEMINGVAGFSVSYADPDPDGNQRSSVTTLLNGANSTLYVITEQSMLRGLDLLDANNASIPPQLAQIRNSFFLIPPSDLVATSTPIPTSTPFLTATPAP
ncbi:MAG: hypothetical protein U0528_00640 [Anaerolineae bacterium]